MTIKKHNFYNGSEKICCSTIRTSIVISSYLDIDCCRISLYGVHIFHTKYPRVEEYVQKFSSWVQYEHRVVGEVKVSL